jgi:C1A family cysteine protease
LHRWEKFKTTYHRSYGAAEEATRFKVFLSNLRLADERNHLENASVHGITQFSDMEDQEFRSQFLMNATAERNMTSRAHNIISTFVSAEADWTGILTTPVKDQGHCGSCWVSIHHSLDCP